MALSILGAQPLEELEAWARELFAAVPTGAGPRPTFPDVGSPYEVSAHRRVDIGTAYTVPVLCVSTGPKAL